ncbi:hypothetical protein MASR2M78_32960 [Treponema sp.]
MKAKPSIFYLFLYSFLTFSLFAQDTDDLVLSYQRNFARASLSVKLDLLREAANDPAVVAIGPLYEQALDFALQNADLLREDPLLFSLASRAAEGLGSISNTRSVQSLWRLFMAFRDPGLRVSVLGSLAKLGKGDGQVVENLNQFLTNQNNLFKAGLSPDLETLKACISALAVLGDGTSFPVLFSTMTADYPEAIQNQASRALQSIKGDYKKYLIDVIRKNNSAEKLIAFKAGVANTSFNAAERGELAEAALEISLGLYPSDEKDAERVQALRYSAVNELAQQHWTRATPLVIKHFYRTQTDYAKSLASKTRFLEAISCLGAMASSEAAQALSLQLGVINSEMERDRSFDSEILLAVIAALGEIGDKVAFDYLLYIGYLPYPDQIRSAAREALNRLKW